MSLMGRRMRKIGMGMKTNNSAFKIYIPLKKFYRSNDFVAYLLVGFGILSVISFAISNSIGKNLALIIGIAFLSCMMLMFLVCIALAIRAIFRYQTLYGDLDGQVIFNSDNVVVNEKAFTLSEIEKITFSLIDYRGMYIGRQGGIDGRKSQGVENTFSLHISDNELTYQFQLLYKGQIKEIREQLISYHLAGKLHFLHLIDLLGITKYEDIQKFKQQLATGQK